MIHENELRQSLLPIGCLWTGSRGGSPAGRHSYVLRNVLRKLALCPYLPYKPLPADCAGPHDIQGLLSSLKHRLSLNDALPVGLNNASGKQFWHYRGLQVVTKELVLSHGQSTCAYMRLGVQHTVSYV